MKEFWAIKLAENAPGNETQVLMFDTAPLRPDLMVDRSGNITKSSMMDAAGKIFAIPVDIQADFMYNGKRVTIDWE